MRLKYLLMKIGIGTPEDNITRIALEKGYSYSRARNLKIHTNLNLLGMSLNTKTSIQQHEKVMMAIATIFEGEQHINVWGKRAVINKLFYANKVMPREYIHAYICIATDLTKEDIDLVVKDFTIEFLNLMIQAIVGVRIQLVYDVHTQKSIDSTLTPLTTKELEPLMYKDLGGSTVVRTNGGVYLINIKGNENDTITDDVDPTQ